MHPSTVPGALSGDREIRSYNFPRDFHQMETPLLHSVQSSFVCPLFPLPQNRYLIYLVSYQKIRHLVYFT